MANLDWVCLPRCYEVQRTFPTFQTAINHPLKQQTVEKDSNPLSSALEGTDPLSQFARQEEERDEAINLSVEEFGQRSKINDGDAPEQKHNSLQWSARRLGILNRFTTNEKLSLSTSFLVLSGSSDGVNENIKMQTLVADKTKYRLEQLDNFDDGSMCHMMGLTQQEYIQRFEQLKQELNQSWHSDQRVKALKIAIQCAKMLADTTVLQFYPSQYVLITDILDVFGKLVYDRLRTKAFGSPGSSAVPMEGERETARETCQNWFYKIASIRELIPRLYLEISIFKCYEFLTSHREECDKQLLRMTHQLRGIADPLVASYARCYLVRMGVLLTPSNAYIRENFKDVFYIYPQIFRLVARFNLHPEIITASSYLQLYAPAFDYMLLCLALKSKQQCTSDILNECKELKHNGAMLLSILNSFNSKFIALNAMDIINMINTSETPGITKSLLLRSLGTCVCKCAPLQERVAFLKLAFKNINKQTDPNEYIYSVEPWATFVSQYCGIHEVNSLLGELNARMCLGNAYEKYYSQLHNILTRIMQNCRSIELLLVQPNLLPYLDLFHKDSIRIEVCKSILSFYKLNSEEYTCDAVVTNALMYIGKILNDSVNALTVDDERRQISQLINVFIHKVQFGRDLEQQLSFYVEARGTFSNLDAVYGTLVQAACKLVTQNRSRSMGFVKACLAFCFITIPSIEAVQQQMDLYLLCGQMALRHLCLGQADACFEAALQLINDLPAATLDFKGKSRSLDQYLVSYLCNMLATLIVVPDSPEQGALYFLRLLLDVVDRHTFKTDTSARIHIYLQALDMLYVQSQEQFPYHIQGVVSNDELYGHDPKFLVEVNNMCAQVVDSIIVQVKALGLAKQSRAQAQYSLELFLRIVRYADLEKENVVQLALKLWFLANKAQPHMDPNVLLHTMSSVEIFYKQVKEASPKQAQSIAKLILHMRKS